MKLAALLDVLKALVHYEGCVGATHNWRRKLKLFEEASSFPEVFAAHLSFLYDKFLPLVFVNMHQVRFYSTLWCASSLDIRTGSAAGQASGDARLLSSAAHATLLAEAHGHVQPRDSRVRPGAQLLGPHALHRHLRQCVSLLARSLAREAD